jgi:hypothetical protein
MSFEIRKVDCKPPFTTYRRVIHQQLGTLYQRTLTIRPLILIRKIAHATYTCTGLYTHGSSADGSFSSLSHSQPLKGNTREYIALKNVERRLHKITSLHKKKEMYGFLSTTEELALRQEIQGGKYHELMALHRSLTVQVQEMDHALQRTHSQSPSKHSGSSAFRSESKRFSDKQSASIRKSLSNRSPLSQQSKSREGGIQNRTSNASLSPSRAAGGGAVDDEDDEARPMAERMPSAIPRLIPAPTFWPGQGLPLASERQAKQDDAAQGGRYGAHGHSGWMDGTRATSAQSSALGQMGLLPDIPIITVAKPPKPSHLYAFTTKEDERKKEALRKQVEDLDDWEFKYLTRKAER